MRFEELAKTTNHVSIGGFDTSQGAKRAVILANSLGKRSLPHGFERRQEVLFFDQKVRLASPDPVDGYGVNPSRRIASINGTIILRFRSNGGKAR